MFCQKRCLKENTWVTFIFTKFQLFDSYLEALSRRNSLQIMELFGELGSLIYGKGEKWRNCWNLFRSL